MYSKLRFICLCFLFFCGGSLANAVEKKQSPVNELQVLIDVSGSMKQNDPVNLRIPAVKLLINLLPEGTKAGIWLFAEKTTELVKTGVVNQQWKKEALLQVNKIHSRGLLTHIEDAIQNAAADWFKSTEQQNRHLILLTDGMVDVSTDIMQSAESRSRIMSDQVPLLQQAGVKVQSIALSADADAELLDKLAFDTQGWSETVLSADQLQKVFFKLFKQAVPQDTVPLTGNAFSIDASIKEFSVLVFKENGAEPTQLIAPDNSKINSKSKLAQVSWLDEKNYDLISIKTPKVGQWKIIATMDPDNQVMIVTDLKFELDEVPKHLSLNETIDITGFFTDGQQLISKKDFLNLIDISIQQVGGKKWTMPAIAKKPGLFSQTIGKELKQGRHTLKIIADGKTFTREVDKIIEVKESLVRLEKAVDLESRTVTIKLIPDKTVINTGVMAIEATISQSGQPAKQQIILQTEGQWLLSVEAPETGESKIVNFSILTNTLEGEAISPNVPAVIIDERLFEQGKEPVEIAKPADKKAVVDKVKKQQAEKEDNSESELEAEPESVNWVKTAVIVLIVNILLIVCAFFAYKYMKNKTLSQQQALLSRLD